MKQKCQDCGTWFDDPQAQICPPCRKAAADWFWDLWHQAEAKAPA